MSTTLLIDLHFLPSLEYFCVLRMFDRVILEKHEHFVKQSFRNRCHINAAGGVKAITIPLTGKHSKTPVREILIANGTRWQNRVWRTLVSAYGNAPFFEHYAGDLNAVLYSETALLFELNLKMLSFCLKALACATKVSETDEYQKEVPDDVMDLRSAITAKKRFTEREFYRVVPYYQVFGNGFAPNLSLIDLLMCTGPEAARILDASGGKRLNK